MHFSWDYFFQAAPILLAASRLTVQITLSGFLVAAILGLVVALARMSRWRVLSAPFGAYVELIRGTPLLVQIFFLFYI
ncbi:MAG: ABC transporter permease subunit, partial [Deinococcus sp.]|nr:ABC transporter permease subunit [Deinococcus sp.]